MLTNSIVEILRVHTVARLANKLIVLSLLIWEFRLLDRFRFVLFFRYCSYW
uniref:Uncharacterized protein n=1 Tax=Arundo donax TaxID=35708 RepID=A0A0A9BCL1_ARUDO